MISNGRPDISREQILKRISEADILGYYIGITNIPCIIHSPLRQDNNPSFYLYSPNGRDVNYIDLSTDKRGACMSLLMQIFNLSREDLYKKIWKEIINMKKINCTKGDYLARNVKVGTKVEVLSKARDWTDYDIKYWESYGIPLEVLKWAEVYPISHKILKRDDSTVVFHADKYAYTFIERKEGKVTQKLYQPFNKCGFKWQNSHDKSVLGLWTKMPEHGKSVCICSSVKDALCLISNMKIPCICLQGEGYPISDTAIQVLRSRFENIFICLDNDEAGLNNAEKLAIQHDFINITIPPFEGGKDISDYFKANGKKAFIKLFKKLIEEAYYNYINELPF